MAGPTFRRAEYIFVAIVRSSNGASAQVNEENLVDSFVLNKRGYDRFQVGVLPLIHVSIDNNVAAMRRNAVRLLCLLDGYIVAAMAVWVVLRGFLVAWWTMFRWSVDKSRRSLYLLPKFIRMVLGAKNHIKQCHEIR